MLSGFHTNIVSALEDLKSDEEFVDVTLSCEGKTLQVREGAEKTNICTILGPPNSRLLRKFAEKADVFGLPVEYLVCKLLFFFLILL